MNLNHSNLISNETYSLTNLYNLIQPGTITGQQHQTIYEGATV